MVQGTRGVILTFPAQRTADPEWSASHCGGRPAEARGSPRQPVASCRRTASGVKRHAWLGHISAAPRALPALPALPTPSLALPPAKKRVGGAYGPLGQAAAGLRSQSPAWWRAEPWRSRGGGIGAAARHPARSPGALAGWWPWPGSLCALCALSAPSRQTRRPANAVGNAVGIHCVLYRGLAGPGLGCVPVAK